MEVDGGTSRSRTSMSTCVPKTTHCVLLLFALMICVIAIAWFVINPQEPSILVSSLTVSNFSVSDSELRGTYDIGINISNTNKKIDMSLSELAVSVLYHEVEIARGTAQEKEPMPLERTRELNLKVHVVVMKVDSSELGKKKKVFTQVVEELSRQVLNFNVRMELVVSFEAGNWPPEPEPKHFNLNCGDVGVVSKDAVNLVGIGGKHDCRHVY
ncbi:hypothetical protein QN277_008304 [Acacia crassicarpa]|uniref:Late embryogenesis abundant protein LEA-2 subgroup domain-containing protein n=1 Tax=Acacia crassicarpa TaxID=499986 RepID=A0AAE1JLG6_9FABA|nr:hypothetical protein QN277_008304 [Acacia crassicarpa]